MVLGLQSAFPIGTYFLSRLEPVTTRWIISGFVFALLLLLLSGWRYRGQGSCIDFRRHRRPVRLLQRAGADRRPADRRLLARPPPSPPSTARANILLFFGASDFFSVVSYAADRAEIHGRRHQILAEWSDLSTASASGSARLLFGTCQRGIIPRDLLRPDRGGRYFRPAGAGWRVALNRESLLRVGKALACPPFNSHHSRIGGHASLCPPYDTEMAHLFIGLLAPPLLRRRATGSDLSSAPIRRNAASAARSPLSQAPSTVPHSVSWVASPARYMQPIGSVRTLRDACPPGAADDIAPSAKGAAFQRVALDFFTAARHRCRTVLSATPSRTRPSPARPARRDRGRTSPRHRSYTATTHPCWRTATPSASNCSAR